ncbi:MULTISPECIES: carbon-nitrogen hydrolase family protein [Agrobacterium]|uniref:Carbon-nitrogen hydrolase family protein n=1 Tax=Agrobacterium pusense TaxID=648995 RepID=A0A6H0ZIA5_9HYPH|nr:MULTISPECIES: carbon-nitrogen hydrolase family protein [Agrobacterium]ANV22988.1 amidohydrolase [Rhizobium sp. S41]KGE79835.1 amidohydrolase [Rhizobium sp. H41]HAU74714.1 carbon-nitrogen hydrolase family protein [Agrobacterium sp.]MDH0868927.1 carbon-nitrogen hydrolase family protein [Agrobacterium pusense]MDH1266907.1 carbon-nitrogen hydrolase family protein [Agrobacterium pusense]
MTQNSNLKRRVRARAAKTGESYTAALQHIRRIPDAPMSNSIRVAVAQTSLVNDPRDISALKTCGQEIRRLMNDAHLAGARLIHFPEGATCWPHKRIMSETGPREIGPSDWTRFEWDTLRKELEATRKLARKLKLWTVLGAVHRLTPPHRPYNSLYVISDRGAIITRYDERLLSKTKISFMYSPGHLPVTFDVDGFRFGCALGMEAHYPEIFMEYEKLCVDCMLFSTAGEDASNAPAFAAEILGHAASNTYWACYSTLATQSPGAPSAIAAPDGQWAAQCPVSGSPAIAVADVIINREHPARPWRQKARGDLYAPHQVDNDPRSDSRNQF